MNLFHKLETAKKVFGKYGVSEVANLLNQNVSRLVKRYSRMMRSKISRLFYRAVSRHLPRSRKLRVLYLSGRFETENGETARYRIYNLRETLRGKAETRFEIVENGVYRDRQALKWADIIVLMRLGWTAEVQEIVRTAQEAAIPLVYDIDDIIFLPRYSPLFCKAIGETDKKRCADFYREFESFHDAFLHCDFATASTPYILERMKEEGKKAFLIHNGLNARQIAIARKTPKSTGEFAYIGYLSGTRTHDRDFARAAGALERIVSEYPNVRLRVTGFLNTASLPESLARKTVVNCFMPWPRLMRFSAKNTINIAPLDIENPFCHAKSELKYFEAAAVGVPTVASRADTFARCIENGVNGFLAADEEEWYRSIRALLDDKELYRRIAENARADVFRNYSPDAIAAQALEAYGKVLEFYNR